MGVFELFIVFVSKDINKNEEYKNTAKQVIVSHMSVIILKLSLGHHLD